MQSIINISKLFILAILSTCILTTWYATNIDVSGLIHSDISAVSGVDTDDSVWNIMRQEFKLDSKVQSARVQSEIRKLLADQNKLNEILKAAAPYIYFIHKQTQAKGLPAELALIPVIESEFNPNDHSNKGATGLWQLMVGTGHDLGVKIRAGYDGRRNVVASTKAALAYFNDLGNLFKGNWYLAIAAYNCGEGRVLSAVRKTGSHSFWNLPLPAETKYYVPKLLAVAAIVKHPEKYGVKLPAISNQPYFAQVKVAKTMNLQSVAKQTGIDIKTLNTLNPDYNKDIPSKSDADSLLVPLDKAPAVRAAIGV